jgi:hypothetical protein
VIPDPKTSNWVELKASGNIAFEKLSKVTGSYVNDRDVVVSKKPTLRFGTSKYTAWQYTVLKVGSSPNVAPKSKLDELDGEYTSVA